MIRNLASAMDGPEPLVEADEYLQPKSRAPLPPNLLSNSTSGSSPPSTPIKSCWPNGLSLSTDSPTPQNQQNWDRELLRYGASLMHAANRANGSLGAPSTSHEHGSNTLQRSHYAHPNGHCAIAMVNGSDAGSNRYCSDPLKMLGVRGKHRYIFNFGKINEFFMNNRLNLNHLIHQIVT